MVSPSRTSLRTAHAFRGAVLVVVALGLSACGTPSTTTRDDSFATSSPTKAVELPTFAPSSVVGALAQGFPRKVVGVPKGATVLASSVERDGDLTTISLSLSTAASPKEVLAYYDKAMKKLSFTSEKPDEVDGAAGQRVYTRTHDPASTDRVDESLTVLVIEDSDRTLVSVSGSVLAG